MQLQQSTVRFADMMYVCQVYHNSDRKNKKDYAKQR